MTGMSTARWMSYTHLTAMGFMAGPDNPPNLLARIGRPVSVSIAIALTVFMAVMTSAPASSAALAISAMFATFGVNFAITGLLTVFFTSFTIFVSKIGSHPISAPDFLMCGHETFSSIASAPILAAVSATSTYFSDEKP